MRSVRLDIIQCCGSTTPTPTKFMDGLQHQYIDSDQQHVCSSFTFMRDWMTRWRGNAACVEKNEDLVIDAGKHRLAKADEKKFLLKEAEK